MATMNSGLGGTAGYGEGVFTSATKAAGNNLDGAVEVDVTSVFGSGGLNFLGDDYSELYINSNGGIFFGTAVIEHNQLGWVDVNAPRLLLFYSDLNLNVGGEI